TTAYAESLGPGEWVEYLDVSRISTLIGFLRYYPNGNVNLRLLSGNPLQLKQDVPAVVTSTKPAKVSILKTEIAIYEATSTNGLPEFAVRDISPPDTTTLLGDIIPGVD